MTVFDVKGGEWEKKILGSKTLVLVEFWHKQCPWCLKLDPIYKELAEEYGGKVKFAKLNVFEGHENQHVAAHYGVASTPTMVFFCDGRPLGAVVGFQPKERLKQLVDDMIDKHRECLEQSTELKTE